VLVVVNADVSIFVEVVMPDVDKSFGLRLKELRTAAGLTQPELADKAGIAKSSLANLEQGRYAPTWAIVQKLAAALGVDCMAFATHAAASAVPSPQIGRAHV
jgi:putative transcriptional regulator